MMSFKSHNVDAFAPAKLTTGCELSLASDEFSAWLNYNRVQKPKFGNGFGQALNVTEVFTVAEADLDRVLECQNLTLRAWRG